MKTYFDAAVTGVVKQLLAEECGIIPPLRVVFWDGVLTVTIGGGNTGVFRKDGEPVVNSVFFLPSKYQSRWAGLEDERTLAEIINEAHKAVKMFLFTADNQDRVDRTKNLIAEGWKLGVF